MTKYKYCPECGSKLEASNKFCPSCGATVGEEKESAAPAKSSLTSEQLATKKKKVKKAENQIKGAGDGAWFLGYAAMLVGLPVSLLLTEWADGPTVVTISVLYFIGSLILIYLGLQVRNIYIPWLKLKLWVLLLLALPFLGGFIPIVVVITCIAALINMRVYKGSTYFQKKQETITMKKVGWIHYIFVVLGAGVLLFSTIVAAGKAETNSQAQYGRGQFISDCHDEAAKQVTSDRANRYCACLYDESLQRYGAQKQYDLLVQAGLETEMPAELSAVIDHCSQI